MTNKPNSGTVSVSRELRSVLAMVLNALDRDAEDGKAIRGEMASELRSLLAQRADQQGEPVAWMCFDFEGGHDFTQDPEQAEAWRKSLGDRYEEYFTPLYRHAQPATAKVDERAEFEKWYLAEYYEGDKQCGLEWLLTESDGSYLYAGPALHWKVWQARTKLNGENL